MFPPACENCGLVTNELTDRQKPDHDFLHWFICKHCEGKLYQHEFRPSGQWEDLCRHCGKKFKHDIHC